MQGFISAQVRQLTRMPNVRMPKPSQCLIVTKMATPSLAAHVGVAPRDFLVSLDAVPATDLLPETYKLRARIHEWVFYSRARHELIKLEATGIEPGVKLQRTPDGIRDRFNPNTSPPSDLEVLWEARDFKGLEDLSRRTLTTGDRDHPALAFLGAALYETGRKPEGIALVDEYVKNFASHWTMNFTGVAYSYLALTLLAKGAQEAGLGMLYTAFEYHSCPRLADLVEKHTGTRPPLETPLWLGRTFPDYRLPRLDVPGPPVSLSDTLGSLNERQLLGVCLLASYRGNGPYNDFMHRYHNFGTWFRDYLPSLHVITMEKGRPEERPYYFKAEDAVKAAKLPLEMLIEDGSLSAKVRQTSSPFIVLVDRTGTVRYEGELDSVDMWTAAAGLDPD
ncbi:MAG: hypothetical protein JJE39_14360 [Vicinamibacteria bacterium]|nr:hypothetical protein [Vicinamibacteria bacterium]